MSMLGLLVYRAHASHRTLGLPLLVSLLWRLRHPTKELCYLKVDILYVALIHFMRCVCLGILFLS